MISCQQYDYIEIACLYKLPIKLCLADGSEIEGIAQDTLRNEEKQECISLKTASGLQIVVLDQLNTMEATRPNPHFERVSFRE
ncbi:Rho-binding antiterminator [Photobacterium halotolerans]|uniref:Rho-binding antiterminator n=1 Tax=Photobacterium halotolerans TaxID=265726 RepID=UPI001929FB78|nr:Rho-binding antiterminator [Photobacterium halotolerans]